MFDLSRITSETFVQRIDYHDELASTNDSAMRMAVDESLVTPLLVLAERQTAGRGRGANRWWSATGALTFSLVWDLPREVESRFAPLVSLIAALSVCETLEKIAPRHSVAVKWPNDVYLEGRKVSGMLIESPSRPSGRTIFGIGVNVNNSFSNAPQELQATAISLLDCVRTELCLTDVLCQLLANLERRLGGFVAAYSSAKKDASENSSPWFTAWRSRCFLSGRVVTIEDSRRQVTGVCQGITAEGMLQLQTQSGLEHFVSGTVRAFGDLTFPK